MTSFEAKTTKRYIVNVRETPTLTRIWNFDTEALATSFAEWNQANGLASEVVEEATTVKCLVRFGFAGSEDAPEPSGTPFEDRALPEAGYTPGCRCNCDEYDGRYRPLPARHEAPERHRD
jgi:hypothetical protein